jgi:hypothetical protein
MVRRFFYGFSLGTTELTGCRTDNCFSWANTSLKRRIRSSNISWARRVRSVKRALLPILEFLRGKILFPLYTYNILDGLPTTNVLLLNHKAYTRSLGSHCLKFELVVFEDRPRSWSSQLFLEMARSLAQKKHFSHCSIVSWVPHEIVTSKNDSIPRTCSTSSTSGLA